MKPIYLAILLAACGPAPSPPGVVVTAAPEVADTVAAVNAELNALRGCEWLSSAGAFPVSVGVGALTGDRLGTTTRWPDRSEIVLRSERELPWVFRDVYLHELGHALGLHHVATGLMQAGIGDGSPTYDEAKAELLKLLDEKHLTPACVERSTTQEGQ